MPSIKVNSRSKPIKGFSEELPSFSIKNIVDKLSRTSRLNANRIRLTYQDESGKQVPLDASKSLTDYFAPQALAGEIVLFAKDLGPQLDWRTVFILEYLGPLVIHALVFSYYAFVKGVPQTETQKLAVVMAVLHFAKREYETIYVHRFSNATMPFFNLFKNSSHYWILSGVFLSYFIYSTDVLALALSLSSAQKVAFHVSSHSSAVNYGLAGLWLFAELSNLSAHVTLSSLRDKDPKAYKIPFGFGFNWVSCPNYFFESLGWLLFALLVGNWSAWLFLIVSSTQMYIWAVKKHKRYLKTFGDDYKKLRRTVYVPYVL